MEQTSTRVQDQSSFVTAFPTVKAVVDHNVAMLHECGYPIATIKAVHTGANASSASSYDAGWLGTSCDASKNSKSDVK
uniref:Uncharacterized protein n=1 Tax=Amphimedon queenslandica TaxID=400682 RepID=A0A1X7VGS9_AMPQE